MQKSITLSALLQIYLKVNRRSKESTRFMTRRAIRYLIEAIGDLKLSQVSSMESEIYQAFLLDKGLCKTSVNSYTKTASPVFSWAVDKEFMEVNPFLRLKKLKVTPKRVETYTPAELHRLLYCCDPRWKAIVMLGLTSLRRAEVLNLTRRDIAFDTNLIYIEPKKQAAWTWEWEPKDYDRRILPLIPQLAELLTGLFRSLPDGQPYLFLKPRRYGYLLRKGKLTERERNCPDNNFNRTFKSLCRRAFICGTFQELRATSLTRLTTDLPLHEVQEIAGHSDVKTTRGYLKVSDDYLSRARNNICRGVAQFG